MTSTATPTRRRRGLLPAGLALGAASVLALAFVAGNGLLPGAAGPLPTDPPGGGIGMCVEQYSLDTLAGRSFAFDGTVSSIAGDSVTFAVNTAYRGVDGRTVTLEAPGMAGSTVTSAGGPSLVEGERYLVAGEDAIVWSCGFTQPYDARVAADWAAALDT